MSKSNVASKYSYSMNTKSEIKKAKPQPNPTSTTAFRKQSASDKENNHRLLKESLTSESSKVQENIKQIRLKQTTYKESNLGTCLKSSSAKQIRYDSNESLKTKNGSTSTKTITKKSDSKPARTSIAASYLGKTADGLAASPKKNRNLDRGDSPKLEQRHVNFAHSGQCKTSKSNPATTPQKNVSTLLKTPERVKQNPSRAELLEKNTAFMSPTVAKIPSDIVRQRVNIIQTPKSPQRQKGNIEISKPIGHIRKSLAGVFEQRKSSGYGVRKSIQEEEVIAEDFSVTVAVRVRPFSKREIELEGRQIVFMNGNETVVDDGSAQHSFVYDHSLWSFDKTNGDFASQSRVYEALGQPLLFAAFDGYNTCLFAYGQTGSGKSYTIMGLGEDRGVVPRFCDEMFSCIESKQTKQSNLRYHVQVSYFEIYNEKIHDLLVSSTSVTEGNHAKQVLKVREHPTLGPYVEGLSKFTVSSFNDVQAWIEVGNRQRATAATGMNDKSSRSHSVFTMEIVQTTTEDLEGEKHESNRRSQVNLVDLAGSERSSSAGTSGQRLKEGASINKSLLTLGKVISSLSERSMAAKRRKKIFVPYRDSTLTWILRESLGGNSRTAMIATVSPAHCHLEETLSTLRYAQQARTIVNLVKVNEDPNARIIRELKAEIAKLKASYGQNEVDPKEFKASLLEVSSLRNQLHAAEREKDEVQEAWKKKLEQSEKRKAEEINELKRAGVSFKVDNQLPNLVNLNEDPQLSELLLYMIKHGVTRIGKKGSDSDIQLNGALIEEHHCKIYNVDEVVSIESLGEAKTFVNGELITKMVVLHHGDRVIIGGDHFFRLNNPIEVHRGEGKRNSGGPRKDFDFAKHELIKRQNERLQIEVEEAQLQVKREMLGEMEAAKQEAEQQISTQRSEFEKQIENLQAQLSNDQDKKRELETICEQAEQLRKERREGHKSRSSRITFSPNDIKNQVLATIEAEQRKLAEETEKLQRKRALAKASPSDSSSDSVNHLRLSLLLQEANKISQSLKKHTVFSRYDVSEQTVKIKLHNTELGIWTLWSFDKFEDKLEMMRDLYNGVSDSNSGSEDGEESTNLFYDPKDEWREVYTHITDTPTTDNNTSSRRLSRRLSSLVLARASPALQQSLDRLNTEQRLPLARHTSLENTAHINLCKRKISTAIENTNTGFDSLMDKFLLSLNQIESVSRQIAQSFCDKEDYSSSTAFYEDSLCITNSIETLLSVVGFIKFNSVSVAKTSPSVNKLLHQIEKAAKKVAGLASMLLHGCHSDIEQMVNDSSARIYSLIPNLSKYGGAVTIATDLTVAQFSEDKQQNLSHRMKHAFLQGGDTFMRKILSGGIERINQIEDAARSSQSDSFENMTNSVVKLLSLCMDLQAMTQAAVVREVLNRNIFEEQELYDSSLMVQERDVPSHYYDDYLSRTQALIQEVGVLVDGVTQINANIPKFSKTSAFSEELRLKAESLWRPTTRIADLCVKHEGLCAIMHDISMSRLSVPANPNSNQNNNKSSDDISTDVACDRLCDDVFDAAKSVQEVLRELIEFADAGAINNSGSSNESDSSSSSSRLKLGNSAASGVPRRKRILPSSPPQLQQDGATTSFVVKNAVEKWLHLADSPSNMTADNSRNSELLSNSVYV